MAEQTYKIGVVAKMLDITTPALRQWSEHYTNYLSSSANPGRGQVRYYTDEDVAVLQRIAKLRSSENLTHDDILLRFAMESAAFEDAPELPQTAQEPLQQPLAPAVGIDALSPLLTAMQENSVSAERLRAVSDEQRQQRADLGQIRLLLYALLVIMVLVLVAVVMLVAVMR